MWSEVNRVKLVLAAGAGVIVAAGGAVFGALYKTPLTSLPWALCIWIALAQDGPPTWPDGEQCYPPRNRS